ncbi:hypothetical protein [Kitasatospora sp. GP82]|uniref:hypothetical protein n=1 Tax=Kitasatospora sp. GP82 TaxID=3035089 RepID=UPI002476AC96|nr:hypothetical protein [Kitasatospora sp. GP82]MDH6130259.1 hypothetical protein [Kitasatospora sp. GP82]
MTARVAGLAEAKHGFVQLTFDRVAEDARQLGPVIDKANGRYGTGTIRAASLTTHKGRSSGRADCG